LILCAFFFQIPVHLFLSYSQQIGQPPVKSTTRKPCLYPSAGIYCNYRGLSHRSLCEWALEDTRWKMTFLTSLVCHFLHAVANGAYWIASHVDRHRPVMITGSTVVARTSMRKTKKKTHGARSVPVLALVLPVTESGCLFLYFCQPRLLNFCFLIYVCSFYNQIYGR